MSENRLSGMQMICKICGGMTVTGSDGKKVVWVWDYARDCAVRQDEMDAARHAESERRKWERLRLKADQGSLL